MIVAYTCLLDIFECSACWRPSRTMIASNIEMLVSKYYPSFVHRISLESLWKSIVSMDECQCLKVCRSIFNPIQNNSAAISVLGKAKNSRETNLKCRGVDRLERCDILPKPLQIYFVNGNAMVTQYTSSINLMKNECLYMRCPMVGCQVITKPCN